MKNIDFIRQGFFLFAIFIGLIIPNLGFSQSGKNQFDQTVIQPKFVPSDQAKINRAIAYLEGLRIIQGRFKQTDHKARLSEGAYFLSRPGKIRFEYDKPRGSVIIADGKWVHKWDDRLKTNDRFALDQTPLSLILKNQIHFNQGVIITKVMSDQKGFDLLVRDRRKQVEGQISLRFETQNTGFRLHSWTITDAQGHATKVELLTIEAKKSLSPTLFVPFK